MGLSLLRKTGIIVLMVVTMLASITSIGVQASQKETFKMQILSTIQGTEIDTLNQASQFKLAFDVNLYDDKYHENDLIAIALPQEFIMKDTQFTMAINDKTTGEKMADLIYDSKNHQLELIFTDYVEEHHAIELSFFVNQKINQNIENETKKNRCHSRINR
ncbi:Ig-like domain-containing protein [Brochothrix campestris]|uniref:LPXTG-motif cell wall anchor domain-containing protein n=1 Tax=Brochothrix campestris FSL F6-1037 TaxID=1265861 RepID=W7C880_9LIST|nr:Ig-like domain-containing protein [Brochothrix campestris]EUJ35679.1 LPXTG-motif cell wall anchor domain-containing protein [Brochothrix campestris FSL F6-1037]